MPRQSHILVVAALGLVVLVAGAAWWIAEPASDSSAAIEPARVEPEAHGEQEPLTAADLSDAFPEGREAVAIDASTDDAPESEIAADAPAHRASVSAQLLDAATSEPLPDYAFELIDSKRQRVNVLTDAEGRFEATLHAGPLRARYSELARREWIEAGELRFGDTDEAEPLVLRVASGPTYRLAISPRDAVPPEKLGSRLRLRVGEEDLRANGRVRGGAIPWTRLAPIAADPGSQPRLTLESVDGDWRGSAQVAMGPGVRPGIVSVVLEAFSALEVSVLDTQGHPVPRASVDVELGADRQGSQTSRTNEQGRARFAFLSGSECTLTVRDARYEDWRQPVLLRPGQLSNAEVRLVSAPSAGAIRGLVLSDTGRYREDVWVNMAQLDREDSPGPIGARVEWVETAGITTGRFEILDVPPGRWRLSVSESDWFDWEPRSNDVEAPLEGVQLRVHDAVAVVDVTLHPQLENGQAYGQFFDARISSGGTTEYKRSGNGGGLLIDSLPLDRPLRWRIDAPGFAPEIGDWSAFVLEPRRPEDSRELRSARPVLVAGWGELYRVTRSDNRKAVEGAVVLVDGREMGKTDKNGRVYVRTATKPKAVTFRYRDWKLDRKIDLSPPRSGSREIERSVRLQVPKPKAKK